MQNIAKLFCLFCFAASSLYSVRAQTERDVVGASYEGSPFFSKVNTLNHDQSVLIGIYSSWLSENITAHVFVVLDKSAEEWSSQPELDDVTSGGSIQLSFTNDGIEGNIYELCEPFELEAYPVEGIGIGYDVVIDVDGTGTLTSSDIIDGLDGPGFYVVGDIVQPGPHAVITEDWTGVEELNKRIWYPSDISEMQELPLVVISHGWTHEYTYYDHLGSHLASYGYIVMSHWNDVGNGNAAGTNSASLSLIANVDHLLATQDELFGGVLNGHINHHAMCWTGHSTGGETPVRAYTRLRSGQMSSAQFEWQDVQLISSICPVAFLNGDQTNPYDVNYHQFLGGADTDASGFAGDGYYQPLTIFERSTGNRQVTYIHGAGHEVFHDFFSTEAWPDSLASGPDLVGKAQVHPIMKSYLLSMCEWYLKGNAAGKDYLTRSYSVFHPMGLDPDVVVTNEYRDGHYTEKEVIDDFQSNYDPMLSSSGAGVSYLVINPEEILMADTDGSFAFDQDQPSNGMTRARFDDDPRCSVLNWDVGGTLWYYPSLIENINDFDYFSFRVAMPTRHPVNEGLSDINFDVMMADQQGNICSTPVGPFAKVTPPYQRDEGGEIHICLEPGDYTVEVGGTVFASETFFEIPGYVEYSTTGSYEFSVADTDSCTMVDIFMYDTYGDGWDDGDLTLYNSNGDTLAYGTLEFGYGPIPGAGWQNEFISVRIPIDVLSVCNTPLDPTQIISIGFGFGAYGQGAIAIDDIEFVAEPEQLIVNEINEYQNPVGLLAYPNPASDFIYIIGIEGMVTLTLSDVSGNVVYESVQSGSEPLDILGLAPGIYLVGMTSEMDVRSTTLVKY